MIFLLNQTETCAKNKALGTFLFTSPVSMFFASFSFLLVNGFFPYQENCFGSFTTPQTVFGKRGSSTLLRTTEATAICPSNGSPLASWCITELRHRIAAAEILKTSDH